MSFDELLKQLAYDYTHPPKLPDGTMDCDRNGHTRMEELRVKYHLSAMKAQKLLVTAGVYEPVKVTSSYYTIKKLYEAGKTMEEIMAETGLSKAVVNASIPHERGVKNLDDLGVGITGDAKRKRKQRKKMDKKMVNARNVLDMEFTDESFWDTIKGHDAITFINVEGQRFNIHAIELAMGQKRKDWAKDGCLNSSDADEVLMVTPVDEDAQVSTIAKTDVLECYHKALELKAEDKNVASDDLGEQGNYLFPILVFIGVINGDRSLYTTKRINKFDNTCSCCGRKVETLYPVKSFSDLCKLNNQFAREREERLAEREKEIRGQSYTLPDQRSQLEAEKARLEREERARNSEAVRFFDEEGAKNGSHEFCKLCAATIYMALEEGDVPATGVSDNYDKLPTDAVKDFLLQSVVDPGKIKSRYINAFREVFEPYDFDNSSILLYKCPDKNGEEHFFSMSSSIQDHAYGDKIIHYRAMEVHKLTKAKKVAVDNAFTDYDISHFKMVYEGDDIQQKSMIGFLELEEKIKSALMQSSLYDGGEIASNLVSVREKHYGIGDRGEIIPVMVSSGAEHLYTSLIDREWCGDEYGFLIDGIIFSGQELATMCSTHEGWRIRFSCDDPSDAPLRSDEYLVPVRISEKALVSETVDLINMFTTDTKFEREKDRDSFRKMFDKVLDKLKFYHNSNPRGYGKLAGMAVIKKLEWVDGADAEIQKVREIIK